MTKNEKEMTERERVLKLKEQLLELRRMQEKEDDKVELMGVSDKIVDQKANVKTLGTHPSAGRYGKSLEGEERGFSNIWVLAIILVMFQLAFIATLYFLFR